MNYLIKTTRKDRDGFLCIYYVSVDNLATGKHDKDVRCFNTIEDAKTWILSSYAQDWVNNFRDTNFYIVENI